MAEFSIGYALPDGVMFYIGNFVALFSRIEGAASFTLWKLSGLPSESAAAFVNNMGLKDKLAAIRALAVPKLKSATKLEKREYRIIDAWMTYTEATLVMERNRVVHDEWHPPVGGGEAARRVKQHSLVKRPQSFQMEVEYSQTKHIDKDYLCDLCIRTNEAGFAIGLLGHFFGPDTPGIQMMTPPPSS